MANLPPFSLDPDLMIGKALASSKNHGFLARGFGVSDSPQPSIFSYERRDVNSKCCDQLMHPTSSVRRQRLHAGPSGLSLPAAPALTSPNATEHLARATHRSECFTMF